MDSHLTDLDALILKVRARRSRDYIVEAVAAYRVGAYKAAVVGTWIAASFDILSKIRELSQAGDKAAKAFIGDFDKAVAANNRERLLKLEGELLDKAADPFAFIGPQERMQLSRLREDRHLCAHPAFSTEAELFQPPPELVRLHIVNAVEMLLAAAPVQGKSLIAAFVDDLPSPAFPRDREQAIRYVTARYLARLRPSAFDGFAAVLVKTYLRRDVPALSGNEVSLLHSLAAIARHQPQLWESDVRQIVLRLIDEAGGSETGYVFGLLGEFPDILDRLSSSARIRLEAAIDNYTPQASAEDVIFAALDLDGFSDRVRSAYEKLNSEHRGRVLSLHPNRFMLLKSLQELVASGSFRRAETIFQRMVTPLAAVVMTEDLVEIAAAISKNMEVWDASAVPRYLADFIERVPSGVRFERTPWASLQVFLEGEDRSGNFDVVWDALARRGVSL